MRKTLLTALLLLPSVASASYSANDLPELSGSTAEDEGFGDYAGYAVASGDVNGDGYADVIIGAPSDSLSLPGRVYLVYGGAYPLTDQNLSDAVTFSPSDTVSLVGLSVSSGDINGDGYDDIIMGSSNAIDQDLNFDSQPGTVYIVYGQATALSSLSLTTANSTVLTGEAAGDEFGGSVAAADIDGDTVDDVIVGAHYNGNNNEGAVYLYYGIDGSQLPDSTVSASTIELRGANSNHNFGLDVSSIGDNNNDGFDDVAITAPGVNSSAGRVYVLYGQSAHYTAGLVTTITTGKLNGETAGDEVGYLSNGSDINADGYDDFLVQAPGTANGTTYVVYGQSSSYGSGTLGDKVRYTGSTAGMDAGHGLALGDVDQDSYSDLALGTYDEDDIGETYVVPGGTNLHSATLAGYTTYTGPAENDYFGSAIASGDFNNDTYSDLVVGAPGADSNYGNVYIVYSVVDTDGDGEPGTDGVMTDGTDCNDNDATVTADQTYYVDADGDGLGSAVSPVMQCSSTAPAGYVSNDDDLNDNDADNDGISKEEDTDDTSADLTYEIIGDDVDNDGDGEVDENNTLTENGIHTYYDLLDPDDADDAASTLSSVRGKKNGKIKVTYSDDSVYIYTVFSRSSDRKTKVKQYKDLGYYVVVQSNGKKVALVNAYTGEVYHRKQISQKSYRKTGLLIKDLRRDGKTEAIVTNKKGARVQVSVVKVNRTTRKLKKRDSIVVQNSHVNVTKTKVRRKQVRLRNTNGRVLMTLHTNRNYRLSE